MAKKAAKTVETEYPKGKKKGAKGKKKAAKAKKKAKGKKA